MARMRYVAYQATITIPAGESGVVEGERLLRDILPDERFRIHSVLVTLTSALAPGDGTSLGLAKNVSPLPTPVIDGLGVSHGILAFVEMAHVAAAATVEIMSIMIPFPEPLDFDADDSLNLRLAGTNTAATPEQIIAFVIITYHVG